MASPDYSTGTMLALYPDAATAKALAVPGGLPVDELHVTVAYTGTVDEVDHLRLLAAAEAIAGGRQPFVAMISGHARFVGGGDGDVIVALVDSPLLERLRRDTIDALGAQGVAIPSDHGFTAHCTIAYIGVDDPDPVVRLAPRDVTFGALSVVYGEIRTDIPFTGGLGMLAREAYAQGWALSGGPMTDRVRAGCTAAVDIALANPGAPGILEATLHLGHLEGVWAAIYERREQVHTRNDTAIKHVWRALDLSRHAHRIVRAYRRRNTITEAADDWLTALVQQLINEGMTSAEIEEIQGAIRQALLTAAAEGQAGAVALSADQIGRVGIDFDIAFDHAYRALEDAGDLVGDPEVNAWLATLIGDQAAEVGSTLARMTRDGAGSAEMDAAVGSILDAEGRSLTLGIDLLTSRAMSQGALSLYRTEGLEYVDLITAGDQRVCQACADAEANSPYLLIDAPVPGLHPGCRCSLAPTVPLPGDAIDRFLAGTGEGEDEELAAENAAASEPVIAANAAAATSAVERAATTEPAVEQTPLQAAQARQADIDVARRVADSIAQVDEMLGNEAEPDTLRRSITNTARRLDLPDDVRDEWLALVDDPDALRVAIGRAARDADLTPIGQAGGVTRFDRALHKPLGDWPSAGDWVEVVRPGYTYGRDGEDILLSKAVVESADDAEWRAALDERERDVRALLEQDPASVRPLGGGMVGETDQVIYRDGQRLVRKGYGQRLEGIRDAVDATDAEELGPLVVNAVGSRAPAVVRDGTRRVWMEMADGQIGADIVPWGGSVPADVYEGDDAVLLGLADSLMANADRNTGNWLMGAAFESGAAPEYLADFAGHFVGPDGWAATNDMSPADMATIGRRLRGLRPDFERLGHLDWWDDMMDRMDILTRAASGTRSRL